jgi:hypothetical protein
MEDGAPDDSINSKNPPRNYRFIQKKLVSRIHIYRYHFIIILVHPKNTLLKFTFQEKLSLFSIKMQITQVITFIAIVISGVISAVNGMPPPGVFLPPISYAATQF